MKVCVIGLGNYGRTLAVALARLGAEVLAVDMLEDKVNAVKDEVSFAATMNSAEMASLRQLPLREMDAVVVAIGESFEGSVLTTANLQELGVERIITRVINPVHERLLKLMNIGETVQPESYAASSLSRSLMVEGVLAAYRLGQGYEVVELEVPPRLVGKTLVESKLRERYQINLITVKRRRVKRVRRLFGLPDEEEQVLGVVEPNYVFAENDILVVFGADRSVRLFAEG